ncbi:MAG TPA: hypothetical protein VGL51_03505 [Solirubrobacteraceae bacterium]|jgi:hypothetical protein
MTEKLNGAVRVGFPLQSINAFLRISTHARAFQRPLDPVTGWERVIDWLAAPVAWLAQPLLLLLGATWPRAALTRVIAAVLATGGAARGASAAQRRYSSCADHTVDGYTGEDAWDWVGQIAGSGTRSSRTTSAGSVGSWCSQRSSAACGCLAPAPAQVSLELTE